jgi:hypothetical protein
MWIDWSLYRFFAPSESFGAIGRGYCLPEGAREGRMSMFCPTSQSHAPYNGKRHHIMTGVHQVDTL